ncbi:MAG TPA: tryptophan--tRNA ligase, partial [bacterium (Candidatus Stahlbacteria)]|nr:tryptophan--tRNA ligase [Candidatus Stahlbacteria bacterium]
MKGRILSGHRVSGKLHMGHLFGTLFNWVKLQDEYECFFEIADLHALTTDYEKTDELKRRIIDITKGWLACGLTLDKSTLFVQSRVSEHAELHLLFSMLVLVNRLERMPTLKEKIRDLNLHNRVNYGLLGYPVLQAADILVYKADAVPVGEDQLAHIEITREIARKFNSLYREVFPEPKALLTKFPRVPGIDGRRMAKSLQNSILIDDDVDTIKQKVMRAYTDPK